MSRRPQTPVPGNADDSIVVIVKRNNHHGVSALLITVMILAGAFWIVKGGQSKAAVPTATNAPEARPTISGKSAKLRPDAPTKTADVIPPSSGISPSAKQSSGRATFFEATEDAEAP